MIIGIERSDGGLSVMTLAEGIQTVEEIDVQVRRWEEGNGEGWTCIRWEALNDYPPRENRNAYELGKFSAVLNEAKIEPEPISPMDEIDALKSRIAKLETRSALSARD